LSLVVIAAGICFITAALPDPGAQALPVLLRLLSLVSPTPFRNHMCGLHDAVCSVLCLFRPQTRSLEFCLWMQAAEVGLLRALHPLILGPTSTTGATSLPGPQVVMGLDPGSAYVLPAKKSSDAQLAVCVSQRGPSGQVHTTSGGCKGAHQAGGAWGHSRHRHLVAPQTSPAHTVALNLPRQHTAPAAVPVAVPRGMRKSQSRGSLASMALGGLRSFLQRVSTSPAEPAPAPSRQSPTSWAVAHPSNNSSPRPTSNHWDRQDETPLQQHSSPLARAVSSADLLLLPRPQGLRPIRVPSSAAHFADDDKWPSPLKIPMQQSSRSPSSCSKASSATPTCSRCQPLLSHAAGCVPLAGAVTAAGKAGQQPPHASQPPPLSARGSPAGRVLIMARQSPETRSRLHKATGADSQAPDIPDQSAGTAQQQAHPQGHSHSKVVTALTASIGCSATCLLVLTAAVS
jgi:hypothetical protein